MYDIAELRSTGLARLPKSLECVSEIVSYFGTKPVYDSHVKVYSSGVPFSTRENLPVCCYAMKDVVLAPHFFELVCRLTPFAGLYLNAAPRLYSMNAFWSRPSEQPPVKDLQTFHRDKDDSRFVTLFVYGTDVVDYRDGPHIYQIGTHRQDKFTRIVSVCGRAGTSFLVDTSGLHRGQPPQRNERLLLWARWGVSQKPASYEWDKLQPVERCALGERYPKELGLRAALELVVS